MSDETVGKIEQLTENKIIEKPVWGVREGEEQLEPPMRELGEPVKHVSSVEYLQNKIVEVDETLSELIIEMRVLKERLELIITSNGLQGSI